MKNKTILSTLVMVFVFTACASQTETAFESPKSIEFIEDDIFTKSGDRVSLAEDNMISLWDGEKETELVNDFNGYEAKIAAIAVSPDEKYLAVGGRNECDELHNTYISLFKFKEYYRFEVLMPHADRVNDLAFSSDGRYLVSASADDSVKIWGMDDFKLKQTISFHQNDVYGVQMIKEGEAYNIISIGYDNQIALHTYDADTNRTILQKSHKLPYGLKYIAYNENKKEMAVAGEAHEAIIYDLQLNHVKTIQTPMVPHRLRYGKEGKALLVGGGRYSSRVESYKTSDYTRY